jgi:hypothetical protein
MYVIQLDQYTLDINITEYSAGEGAIPKPSVEFEIVSGIELDEDGIMFDMTEADVYAVMKSYSGLIEEKLIEQIKRNREDVE